MRRFGNKDGWIWRVTGASWMPEIGLVSKTYFCPKAEKTHTFVVQDCAGHWDIQATQRLYVSSELLSSVKLVIEDEAALALDFELLVRKACGQ